MGRRSLVLAVAALAAGVGLAWIMVANDVRHASGLEVALVLVIGWSFVAAGLVVWHLQPENRIGPVMVLTGFLRFAAALFASQDPLLFTIGHVFEAAYLAGVVYVILSFPGGRLETSPQRLLFGAAVLAVGPLDLMRLMVGGHDPQDCIGCPRTVLVEVIDSPGTAQALQLTVYGLGAVVAVSSIAILLRRWRRATPRLRFAIAPVLWVGAAAFVGLFLWVGHGVWTGNAAIGDPHAEGPNVAFGLVIASVAFAFLIGLERTRLARSAVAGLVVELGTTPGPGELRSALARALRDPSLAIAYWLPEAERYVDAEGRAIDLADGGEGRSVTMVQRDGRRIAALLHDPALRDDHQLVESVCAAAALALENEQLQADLRARLDELSASRTRVVEAAQAERRRIERDLHDGTQQQLVSVAMTLGLVEAKLAADPEAAQRSLHEARASLSSALEDLRELSHGIYPGTLTERGLAAALRDLATRAHLPVELTVSLPARLPDRVETAAYLLVSEALTNVAKYAHATSVEVGVECVDGELVVRIEDDGTGGANPNRGSGLRGLRDRVEALGGHFAFTSPLGEGTVVEAEIPCE